MNVQEQIDAHIASQPQPKRSEMLELHQRILKLSPGCKLWYTDGKNADGKFVTNPDIGYGLYTIKYANGSTREFYQIGLSATAAGISIYILGLEDKKHLINTYGTRIGKASVTGYCIKFKSIKDINIDVLEEAIRYRFLAE